MRNKEGAMKRETGRYRIVLALIVAAQMFIGCTRTSAATGTFMLEFTGMAGFVPTADDGLRVVLVKSSKSDAMISSMPA
jgi:hypothetical protein